jgi:RHS repeat-associated protein
VALTPGNLTPQYTQSFAYDNLGRLTNGPRGAYTYGDSGHLHAATAIGTTWTASYDAAGNMTCRAPSSTVTCSGSQTGAQLSYDAEGSLTSWQNTPTNPSVSDGFLYDNQGNRVEQQVTQNGSTTTTIYVGNLEEVVKSGSTTTTTTYYYAGATRIAEAVNGVFSYLASDALGSADVALNASGSLTASVLYYPYGGARYTSGTMPTDYGFTGQHSDSATGLDYYNARYYDALAGQFSSADPVLQQGGYDILGLSRYAYVEGNPVVRTDPSGNHVELGCEPYCGADMTSSAGTTTAGGFGSHDDSHSPARSAGRSSLMTEHRCTGRCKIIMQLLDESNPPGDPVSQWLQQQLEPDIDILSLACIFLETCGGTGLKMGGQPAALENEPGDIAQVTESMSARAAAYQEEVTGLSRGTAYVLRGVKFDGYAGDALIEAKGPGYANFVGRDGQFYDWFRGRESLLAQAGNQIRVARQGTPIIWYVAEQKAQQAMIKLLSDNGFEGINVIYRPPDVP